MSTAIVVTGATGGLGSELVRECFAREDSDRIKGLFGMCRNQDKFSSKGFPERCHCVIHDAVAPHSNYSRLLELINEATPQRIICIHTAFSIAPIAGVGNMSDDQISDNVQCNVTDTVRLVNALACYSRGTRAEIQFVNIDSGAARRPIQGWSLYCSAKAYINMFLQCCVLDLPAFSYVSYDPGVVDTGMQKEIRNAPEDDFPDREIFEACAVEGALHDPRMVAKDIVKRFVMRPVLSNTIEKYRS